MIIELITAYRRPIFVHYQRGITYAGEQQIFGGQHIGVVSICR